MLIHGLYASTKSIGNSPASSACWPRNYRAIALDLPGHGESDKPENEAAYGVQMVEDVRLLLDHLKIRKAHVVGYSLGGMVTAKFLTMHQDRVRSAILGGMGWLRQGSGLQKTWERMPAREGVRAPPRACAASANWR